MRILLDTNVCIAIINDDERVRPRLELSPSAQLGISTISLGELHFGIAKSRYRRIAMSNLAKLTAKISVVDFDRNAAATYGPLRAELERKGSPIGSLDTLIAAHALSLNWRLATNNVREFARVPGLHVEDWLTTH